METFFGTNRIVEKYLGDKLFYKYEEGGGDVFVPAPTASIISIFPDTEVANHIKTKLKKTSVNNIVSQDDLDTIQFFGTDNDAFPTAEYGNQYYFYSRNITTLEGIQFLRNLVHFNICSNGSYLRPTSVDISMFNNLESLKSTFYNNKELTDVKLPGKAKIKNLNSSFRNTKLKEVIIPEGWGDHIEDANGFVGYNKEIAKVVLPKKMDKLTSISFFPAYLYKNVKVYAPAKLPMLNIAQDYELRLHDREGFVELIFHEDETLTRFNQLWTHDINGVSEHVAVRYDYSNLINMEVVDYPYRDKLIESNVPFYNKLKYTGGYYQQTESGYNLTHIKNLRVDLYSGTGLNYTKYKIEVYMGVTGISYTTVYLGLAEDYQKNPTEVILSTTTNVSSKIYTMEGNNTNKQVLAVKTMGTGSSATAHRVDVRIYSIKITGII